MVQNGRNSGETGMRGGTIKRFEDMKVWQQGRELIREIYTLTRGAAFRQDHALREQIRRAAISIVLNIAEGFALGTDKEFRRFLIQAHGSVAEVQSALYIALDEQYISQPDFDALYLSLEGLSKMILAFARYLGNSNYRRLTSDSRPSTLDSKTHR